VNDSLNTGIFKIIISQNESIILSSIYAYRIILVEKKKIFSISPRQGTQLIKLKIALQNDNSKAFGTRFALRSS
jgi:hypothetical protein